MAGVILGGIITSTLLNMIVIPALYLKFGRVKAKGQVKEFALPSQTLPSVGD